MKVNLTLLACVAALWVWAGRGPAMVTWASAIVFVGACCAVIKLVDVALSMRKGLVLVVTVLAGANAAGVVLGGWAASSACVARWPSGLASLETLLDAFCPNPFLATGAFAIGVGALTLWACSREIYRGIEDVGFVGASLRAERGRRHGL